MHISLIISLVLFCVIKQMIPNIFKVPVGGFCYFPNKAKPAFPLISVFMLSCYNEGVVEEIRTGFLNQPSTCPNNI